MSSGKKKVLNLYQKIYMFSTFFLKHKNLETALFRLGVDMEYPNFKDFDLLWVPELLKLLTQEQFLSHKSEAYIM